MSDHPVVHRRPDAAPAADIASGQVAAGQTFRMVVRREAIASLLIEGRRRPWMHEDAARACKRRSLIDDNPASG